MEQHETRSTQDPVAVEVSAIAGRLQFFSHEWQKITNDPFILKIVTGYNFRFISPPLQNKGIPKVSFKNEKESRDCESEIERLLSIGAIAQCKPEKGQFISSYFLVPKPDGSNRFVLNLKSLN